LLNLDRVVTDMPAPEGLTDFFLTELLSGLPMADFNGNLNFAVQSPFALGWMKLSLNQLFTYALPEFVDNLAICFINGKLTTSVGVGAGAVTLGLKPKHGFESSLTSLLTFDNSSRIFSITAYDLDLIPVWNMGLQLLKATQSIAITNTPGWWYIYYKYDILLEENILVASQSVWDRAVDIPIAKIFWNGSEGVMKDYRYVYMEVNHSPLVRFEDKPHPAEDIYTSTTNFKNLLSPEETTVQKALEKLDFYLKVGKVPFTASESPEIINYQTTQADPEDTSKTINYTETYTDDPNVRCIVEIDPETSYQLQQMPQFTKTDGKLTRVWFDMGGFPSSGYLIISRT
ncbi:MAG TPA: hypothetical protein VIK10_00045, partial [Prolixibacteraceae bacterium]